MRNGLLIILCALGFGAATVAPGHAQSTPYLGQIAIFPYNFCPSGWIEPKGQLLAINSNTALFSLLGTTYGGNGISTFALPNLKPFWSLTEGAPLIQCLALTGVFPSRN